MLPVATSSKKAKLFLITSSQSVPFNFFPTTMKRKIKFIDPRISFLMALRYASAGNFCSDPSYWSPLWTPESGWSNLANTFVGICALTALLGGLCPYSSTWCLFNSETLSFRSCSSSSQNSISLKQKWISSQPSQKLFNSTGPEAKHQNRGCLVFFLSSYQLDMK